ITEKINKELYNLSDKEINKILKLHKNNRDDILNDVGRIILSYNVKDDSLDITSSEQVKLNKEFKDKINNLFKGEIKEEVESINRLLKETAINKYYTNSYAMSLGMDFTIKKVTDKQLERIVNNTIDGKVFSERIWSNK